MKYLTDKQGKKKNQFLNNDWNIHDLAPFYDTDNKESWDLERRDLIANTTGQSI